MASPRPRPSVQGNQASVARRGHGKLDQPVTQCRERLAFAKDDAMHRLRPVCRQSAGETQAARCGASAGRIPSANPGSSCAAAGHAGAAGGSRAQRRAKRDSVASEPRAASRCRSVVHAGRRPRWIRRWAQAVLLLACGAIEHAGFARQPVTCRYAALGKCPGPAVSPSLFSAG